MLLLINSCLLKSSEGMTKLLKEFSNATSVGLKGKVSREYKSAFVVERITLSNGNKIFMLHTTE